MITKLKLAVASVAVVGGLTAAAFANDGPMDSHRAAMREKFDTNKDGKLDDAERAKLHEAMKAMHDKRRAEALAQFDTNKDGKLDDSEREAMRNARIEKRFAMLDLNKDGAITLDEMKAAKPHHGGRFGRHHDKVSK